MTIDEALAHAANELPEGWWIEMYEPADAAILYLGREAVWGSSWGRDELAEEPENILRAVAWAKEQASLTAAPPQERKE